MTRYKTKPYLMAAVAAALVAAMAACQQAPATPATVPEHTHKVTVIGPHTIDTSGFSCSRSASGHICGRAYKHSELTADAIKNRLITVEYDAFASDQWQGLPFIISVGTADYTLDYYVASGEIGFTLIVSDARITTTALNAVDDARYRIKIAE